MIDSHIHTKFSHDGKQTMHEVLQRAKALGMRYLAFTEHLDRDYLYCGLMERCASQLSLEKYRNGFLKAIKDETPEAFGLTVAFGVECGYSAPAVKDYQEDLRKFPYDVIINSVHSVGKHDLYTVPPHKKPTRDVHYRDYLNAVLESLTLGYDYDIVGHIGYVARYVNYADKTLLYDKTRTLVDEVLQTVIERGKTIELNTNLKNLPLLALPEVPILERYFQLGGRQIVFSSDAHTTNRLGEGYHEVVAMVKELGFTNWTVYQNRTPKEMAF